MLHKVIRDIADPFEELLIELGAPAYRGDSWALYRGDCRELMSSMPRESIDLTITSPPYNIGKEYEKIREIEDYIDWCVAWIADIHRVTNPVGSFWLNLGYLSLPQRAKAIPIPYLLWDRVPFYLLQEIVWNYGAGVASKKTFSPRNEKFLWYVKDENHYVFNLDSVRDPDVKYPNQKKNGKLRCNPIGKNPSDVWQFPKVTSGANRSSSERMAHPAQFPLAVIARIILASSGAGDILLDPFSGSGSLLDAATRQGRFAIGFEIDRGYIDMAAKRLSQGLLV